jgi:hypothetical protein
MKKTMLLLFVSILFTSGLIGQTKSLCVPTISFGGKFSGGKLSIDDLVKQKEIKIGCYADPSLIYDIVSFDLVLVPKDQDAFKWSLYSKDLNDNQLAILTRLQTEATIYIDNPKVKSPDGSLILDLPGYAVSVVK